MNPPVLVEAGALSERLVALGTGEGAEPGVHQHVAPQVPGCHKGLVAALTLVRPLPGVDAFMHGQVSRLPEALGAFVAGVWLEAHVGALVPPEAGRVGKHLAALGAEEGFLPRVRAQVGLVGGQLRETFPTLLTLVGLVLGVDSLVTRQRRRAGEGLAAVGAKERLLAGVGTLVVLQVLQLRVRLPTLLTGIRTVALMVPFVLPEHRGVCKALPAFGAEVWLLSSVGALVDLQLGQGGIALVALGARVWSLTAVLRRVDPQADSLHEGFPTLRAHEGFLPGMGAAVVAQLRDRLVRLVAIRTLEGPLGGVGAFMLGELSFARKRFGTFRTCMLLLLLLRCMRCQLVALQS